MTNVSSSKVETKERLRQPSYVEDGNAPHRQTKRIAGVRVSASSTSFAQFWSSAGVACAKGLLYPRQALKFPGELGLSAYGGYGSLYSLLLKR